MVKYGFSSHMGNYHYQSYFCDECGESLGALEISTDSNGNEKVADDIAKWKFCPYCGKPLFPNDIMWFE